MSSNPVIINAAISGSSPPSKSPYLPKSPEQIGQEAVAAWKAGAAVVHIHARDDDGRPSGSTEDFQRSIDFIRAAECDVLINLTTSFTGGDINDHEVRLAPLDLRPDLASYDCGSINVRDHIFQNPMPFLRDLGRKMREVGTKPEIEIFDAGMVQSAVQLAEEGILAEPMYFQFVLGTPSGAQANVRSLAHLVDLLPAKSIWSVCAMGRSQIEMNAIALVMGGHVRTGLEDNLYLSRGEYASNADLVSRLAGLAKTLGRSPATPEQAREILLG